MLLHSSPKARYVKSEKDLSHIELAHSGNISSSSIARTYRVNGVDISTEEKQEQEYKDFVPYTLALLFSSVDMSTSLTRYAFALLKLDILLLRSNSI